jgi:flavin-dependent thymidylate synthase
MLQIIKPSAEVITPDVSTWHKLLELCEECGRVSHRSEGRIREGSAEKFIAKVAMKMGHESILEHASITVLFTGSRAMSHQLVRHRLAAFTQESMRYCDYSNTDKHDALKIIVPPSIMGKDEHCLPEDGMISEYFLESTPLNSALYAFLHTSRMDYVMYKRLRELGIPAEDARFSLPTRQRRPPCTPPSTCASGSTCSRCAATPTPSGRSATS